MKLNRSMIRKMIIEEIEKSIDEEAIFSKDGYSDYGMLNRHDDPGRQMKKTACSECGSNMSMYEGQKVCEQCGYSMAEEETRKEYNSLNEGSCGCEETGIGNVGTDYSTDTMGLVGDALSTLTHAGYEVDASKSYKKHHNNYMAKPSLYKIAKYAKKMLEMIPDGHELDDWQRTKIAQISDDISEVYHSLDYDKFKGDF